MSPVTSENCSASDSRTSFIFKDLLGKQTKAKRYMLFVFDKFKNWEVGAKAITQMKTDIYRHVGTGTGPGIRLDPRQIQTWGKPLILFIINNRNKFRGNY